MREYLTEDTRKKNFILNSDLDKKVSLFAKEVGINFSQLIRNLLVEWVEQREREKIDMEIMNACKDYYKIDKEIAENWRSIEPEV